MFGGHISLFTILWVLTTLIYTWYNSRLVDMSANPAMKYMQYMMPVMFLFFFNNYASGLTAYLMFSNIFNIGQTMVTKNFIIDEEKIKAKLNANKNKPKKKGGFQQRLEKALKGTTTHPGRKAKQEMIMRSVLIIAACFCIVMSCNRRSSEDISTDQEHKPDIVDTSLQGCH